MHGYVLHFSGSGLSSCSFSVFTVEFRVCCCRQQIEDCEREIGRLKDLVKKKEDNEKKYQGTCTYIYL